MTDIYLVPYHAVAALREDTRAWWREPAELESG
jgi:hypothetical protein